MNVSTSTTRDLALGDSYCPTLTGNDRYFALNCTGPGTAPPHMVLAETTSGAQVPVARTSSNGPFFLEAAGIGGQVLWQDRVAGARRVVLFTPTTAIDPARASSSTAPTLVSFEDAALGYRIGLPSLYRRALSTVQADGVGQDFYTPRSEEADRELCQRERGSDIPSSERVSDLKVVVYANASGASPIDFVSEPRRRVSFGVAEGLTIDGHEAARVVQIPTGDTAYYVISANDRLYEISPFIISMPSVGHAGGTDAAPVGWLDQIAFSFRAIAIQLPSGPLPTSRPLCPG